MVNSVAYGRDKWGHKRVYLACPVCGKVRWVTLRGGKPIWELCKLCATRTPEFRRRTAEIHLGRKRTIETRNKMSIAMKGKKGRAGDKHPMWKGGRIINNGGYVKVYCPNHPEAINNYVLEHRLVLEQKMGRPLKRNEVGHHLNGNKEDNRPENLIASLRKSHNPMSIVLPYQQRIKYLEAQLAESQA